MKDVGPGHLGFNVDVSFVPVKYAIDVQPAVDPSDRSWSGGIYDEGRRGWLAPLKGVEKAAARAAFRRQGWNEYVIRAVGNRLQTWVNGVPCALLLDDADADGLLALQVHSGAKGKIRWRNIRVREIETP